MIAAMAIRYRYRGPERRDGDQAQHDRWKRQDGVVDPADAISIQPPFTAAAIPRVIPISVGQQG